MIESRRRSPSPCTAALSSARPAPGRRIAAATAPGIRAVLAAGCSADLPNRNPVGETFPSVAGEALDGKPWRIPEDLAGEPAILLVGFVQDSQFDIDRWLLGITQAGTPVPFLELPTIPGLAPRVFSGTIDEGMRSGIPIEDWRGVVTLWSDDAERVVELTGNQGPRNARVLLIDADGEIVWFADRGYSAGGMVDLDAAARAGGVPARGAVARVLRAARRAGGQLPVRHPARRLPARPGLTARARPPETG